MAHLKLASSKISIELMERLNRYVDSTRLTQSAAIRWAIEQFLDNVEQVPINTEQSLDNDDEELDLDGEVLDNTKRKTTRKFGTPKDRQSIENLKRVFFLFSSTSFYDRCLTAYFDPIVQVFIFQPDRIDQPLNTIHICELWDIPEDHSMHSVYLGMEWEEKIAEVDGQLKESLELLKSLDALILAENHKISPYLSVRWENRIGKFLRGDFEKILSPSQEVLILSFIQSCATELQEGLDEFYVPFVEVQV